MTWLEAAADLATIATAAIAAWAYGSYRLKLRRRRLDIEAILIKKNQPHDDSLKLSQLAADLKLTVEQVLEAAQTSSKVEGYGGDLGNDRRLRYVRKSKNL